MATVSSLLSAIPNLFHDFGTLDHPNAFTKWGSSQPHWKQVHGVEFSVVTKPGEECGQVDALATAQRGIPIAIRTADCVPVLMARKDGKFVAAAHAGWRGTHARIVENVWKGLHQFKQDPSEWVAAIGPAIGPCCYEVSPEIAQKFRTEFPDFSGVVVGERNLDLPGINAQLLRKIGIADVEILRLCTRCSTHTVFNSYRRQHAKNDLQVSGLVIL